MIQEQFSKRFLLKCTIPLQPVITNRYAFKKMNSYLKNIEHAATKIFEAINHEKDKLMSLIQERNSALKEPEYLERLGWDCDLQEDFDETRVMNLFDRAAEARIALPAKLDEIDSQIENITNNIFLHESSERILCGAILQFSKQGISVVHGNLANCPPGRKVGTQDLKDVIWQARNHAIHHEESPNHNQNVLNCFSLLEADFGTIFSLQNHPGTNLSKEVIETLHWNGFETFSEDMLLLL